MSENNQSKARGRLPFGASPPLGRTLVASELGNRRLAGRQLEEITSIRGVI